MLPSHVKHLIVVSDAFPKGQKTVEVVVELAQPVDGTQIPIDTFHIEGRKITKIASGNSSEPLSESSPGCFLHLHMDPETQDQSCYVFTDGHEHHGPGGHGGPGGPIDEGDPGSLPDPGAAGFGMHRNVRKRNPMPIVQQIADITALDGTLLPAWEQAVPCGEEIDLLVREFQVFELDGMKYNLYTPALEAGKLYPLVMFIPDASAVSDNPLVSLMQGNGGIEWMRPEAQAKHPCYVLVPQYDGETSLTNDRFECGPEIEIIKKICDHVANTCQVDKDRIYTTGQSMGCMASCELNIRYPDYFAASLLVAGQWDPEKMSKLVGNNFWICVARNDLKAFPGMNKVTDAMTAAGGKVGKYTWSSDHTIAEFNDLVNAAMADDVHIRHTVFMDRYEDMGQHRMMGHDGTWPVVYSIDALRDWMFSNHK